MNLDDAILLALRTKFFNPTFPYTINVMQDAIGTYELELSYLPAPHAVFYLMPNDLVLEDYILRYDDFCNIMETIDHVYENPIKPEKFFDDKVDEGYFDGLIAEIKNKFKGEK